MNVQGIESQPSTSGGVGSQKRVGDTGRRSVTETIVLDKIMSGEALTPEELLEVKEAMAALNKRKIEAEKEERDGICELQTKAGVLKVNNLPPLTTTEIQDGETVAVYSATGEPVFRLFDDEGKSIIFKRVSHSPYFEQLSTDETVAWSKIFFRNVNYGVKSNSCLGRIGHARTRRECNVEIIPMCKPADIGRMNEIIKTPKPHEIIADAQQICSMALFSEFMEKVEMHVRALRTIPPCSLLRMDYGYDPGKGKPDNVAVVSEESKKRIAQELNEHAKEAEEMKVPSYWMIETSETLEESDKSSSGSETIIEGSETSGSEWLQSSGKGQLEQFKEEWKGFLSGQYEVDLYSVQYFYEYLSPLNKKLFLELAIYVALAFTKTEDVRIKNATKSFSDLAGADIDTVQKFFDELHEMLMEKHQHITDIEWLAFAEAKRKDDPSKKRAAPASDSEEPSTSKKARSQLKI